jgi:uncharacterized protein YbcI
LATESKQATGALLAAVSNMVVGIYADCLGRGPTRARSYIDHDVILCLLEDTLTKPERRLQGLGRDERLLELRATLQQTMQTELIGGMERLVGRQVKALVSGSQMDPDIASEVFVLGESLDGHEGAPRRPVLPSGSKGSVMGKLEEEVR